MFGGMNTVRIAGRPMRSICPPSSTTVRPQTPTGPEPMTLVGTSITIAEVFNPRKKSLSPGWQNAPPEPRLLKLSRSKKNGSSRRPANAVTPSSCTTWFVRPRKLMLPSFPLITWTR